MKNVKFGGVDHKVSAAQLVASRGGADIVSRGWFSDRSRFGGEYVTCIRARKEEGREGCERATDRVAANGVGECPACFNVRHDPTYQQACYRAVSRAARGVGGVEAGHRAKEWMLRRRIERLVVQNTSLKAGAFQVERGRHISSAALRGSLRVVGRRLRTMANEGLLVGKEQNSLLFISNIACNLARKSARGNRHNALSHAVLGLLRKIGGERVAALVTSNLAGVPSSSTARDFMRSKPFNAQLCDEDFKRIAEVYKTAMDRLGLPVGSVPCMCAEDETAVNARPQWDYAQDAVVGYCGQDCRRKCVTVTECRRHGCEDTHACKWEGDFVVSMAGDDYQAVRASMDAARVGTLARAIVINPLHIALPRLTCLWTATCKAFTATEYVMRQWRRLGILFERHIEPVVGRIVGRSSDGDSTRRRSMWLLSYIGEGGGAGQPNHCLQGSRDSCLRAPVTGEEGPC